MNKRPEIVISSLDLDRIYELLDSLPANSFAGKDDLITELERAKVVDPQEMPATVVTMNSTVHFVIESTKKEFKLTLVYPKDIDSSGTKISILAPVGSALLGLSQGDQIEWPKPGGGLLNVKIKEVTFQPERAGDFHL
ncbi:nucleoside diphosphate kinase regulator [Teredinibacter sp. KSP-S5-2]|uniref:nucleoside diphosphate kinase regulator n=1 Tax=Teredinibacter sp. KSP-S5-2 TaxID=3034506 RepID=UPI002934EE0D|nr:nucleoside diphosphate kinase regulator [Teredinibacter sp. KSP-S5-2]WNO08009.1 nucleoside diphosphate kinase regulator [Teredinibacter sp. KSP-S5-2]